ncbi:MAG: hypothetical protein K2M75_03715 [Clostridia bacterium]|nr:hypothetical protein [Clostridia bacterium]
MAMLNNSAILIFSVVALFCALFARVNIYKAIALQLSVLSYVCILFCVTYAFLLGVGIEEVLTYILAYTLIFATVFNNKDEKEGNLPLKQGELK